MSPEKFPNEKRYGAHIFRRLQGKEMLFSHPKCYTKTEGRTQKLKSFCKWCILETKNTFLSISILSNSIQSSYPFR